VTSQILSLSDVTDVYTVVAESDDTEGVGDTVEEKDREGHTDFS
jgi:hypothetical protein